MAIVLGAALVVIPLALLVSETVAGIVGLILVGIGAWRTWGWLRHWLGSRSEA